MEQTVPLPDFIGLQHQFRIRAVPQHRTSRQQLVPQFLPVIYPPVHDEYQAPIFAAERLIFFQRLRRGMQHALAECNRILDPMTDAIRPRCTMVEVIFPPILAQWERRQIG